MSKWSRFFYQVHKDALLWLFVFLFFFLFRFIFIAMFHESMQSSSGIREIVRMAALGLQYDSKFATHWIVIPLLCSIAGALNGREIVAERVRQTMGSIFAVLAGSACIISIVYFREYHEPFNYIVFNAYHDDTKAILATIWADYHPLINLMLIGAVSAAAFAVRRRTVDRGLISRERIDAWTASSLRRTTALTVIVVLLVIGVKGGAFGIPLRDHRDGVTKDEFLNKAIANPFMSLHRAYEDHRWYSGKTGIDAYLADGNVRRAAAAVFPFDGPRGSLDEYMRRIAAGAKNGPPRHVVLFVIESGDSWPLLSQFAPLGLAENLGEFARNGLSVTNFLPSGNLTMQSFTAVLTGIPYTTGVEINYQATSRSPYPSSLAAAFRHLGYRTRLFYGGRLSWQRIGDFARDQGFEEIYGRPHVEDAVAGVESTEWGVLDEYLYHFIVQTIQPDQPSFNVVLTTTNHPPFDLDLGARGYPVKTVPPALASFFDGSLDLKTLGHRWYSDHWLGVFVREAETRLPHALFAITGDHESRRFPNARPPFFEGSAVPFVLYGKDVLHGLSVPPRTAGSHIDIAPTLIELAAPKGFVYYAVGKNLLAPQARPFGIGYHKVIGPDFIVDLETATIHPVPGEPLPSIPPDVNGLKTTVNDYYGIAWWRVKRGAEFP